MLLSATQAWHTLITTKKRYLGVVYSASLEKVVL